MTFITQDNGVVSTDNSSSLNLASGDSYIGTYEEVSEYSEIVVLVILDFANSQQASLKFNFSSDESNNVITKTAVISSSSFSHTAVVIGRYFKVSLLADQGTSAIGAIQTIYHTNKSIGINTTASSVLNDNADTTINRSLITGQTTSQNGFSNVSLTQINPMSNTLNISLREPTSAFGELRSTSLSPIIQITTMYDLISPQVWQTLISNTGSISSSGMKYTISNSLGSSDYTILKSVADCHYRAGQGMLIRFTALYPNGYIANTRQLAGYSNVGNGLFFGYNGSNSSFGIIYRKNGRNQIVKLTITTASSASGTATITLNGTAYNVSLTNASGDTHFTASQIANQITYSGWDVRNIGATIEFSSVIAGPLTGVYSYTAGGSGSAANFTTITTGVNPIDTFIAQSDWNIDTMDGSGPSGMTLNTAFGNVYQISFQWLGYGDIFFYIENNQTGFLQPVHLLEYDNANTTPSLQIPHGPIRYQIENFGVPNIQPVVAGSSAAAFIEGESIPYGPRFSFSNEKSVSSSGNVVLSLTNNYQENGYGNQTNVKITSITISTIGSGNVIIQVYLNATLGNNTTSNFPDWTPINATYSSVLSDTTASTLTDGIIIYQTTNASNTTSIVPQNVFDTVLYTGQIISITAQKSGGGTTDTLVAITWVEDK